jgi:hypothetical protein
MFLMLFAPRSIRVRTAFRSSSEPVASKYAI